MNNIEGKKEKIYLSTLAFLDEDFFETNERYLFEFCKLVIYQNGYRGLGINEICEKINELVLFDYTEEEIEQIINNSYQHDIICEEGIYSLTSNAEKEIANREKNFGLRKHIDLFCDLRKFEIEGYTREDLCNLMMRFLFEKFQQSLEQIYNIIDRNNDNSLEYGEEYTDDEKVFINSFLMWDNEEKNTMVYNLIVKSYDFCTLNCDGKTSFDFSQFHFYLDANIIMRLLGINNEYRQKAIRLFLDKCTKEQINVCVSCFTKIEVIDSIKRQVDAIAREISEYGYIPTPNAIKFAKPDSFTIEIYGKYYEYYKRKNSSVEGFKQYLFKQLDSIINQYNYIEEMSFEAVESELFVGLVDSLKKVKDEKVVKTDVNNVLLVKKKRESNSDVYMISADGKLIHWCKEIFVGQPSLVEFPSVWLSIIMKYTGRASGDDYAAFCKFIRLPIRIVDSDIKRKIELKKRVLSMDVSSQMKDRMLEELEGNYIHYYQNSSVNNDAEKVYEKVMKEHDEKIRKEVYEEKEQELEYLRKKHNEAMTGVINEVKDREAIIERQNEQSVEKQVERQIEKKINEKLKIGEWISTHKNTLILWSLIPLVALGIGLFFVLRTVIKEIDVLLGLIITICTFFIEFVIVTIINALEEKYTNRKELEEYFIKKIRKKYKDLL